MANQASQTKTPALLPILVATREKQGQRKNDFSWCDEDEPVRFASECDGESVDGRCGCRRSMSGMKSLKGTTTFKTVHSKMTRGEYVAMLRACYEKSGFLKLCGEVEVEREAAELLSLAAAFPVGLVIEKRGNSVKQRA